MLPFLVTPCLVVVVQPCMERIPVKKKKKKKSAMKKFLVSYDVFAIFTSVKHKEIPCEAKNKTQKHSIINNQKVYNSVNVIRLLNYAIK